MGRDLFHQVPDIQEESGDAVKRVLTNPREGTRRGGREGRGGGDETSLPREGGSDRGWRGWRG